MGQPGPKPIDTNQLKAVAGMWTSIFRLLRDGREGQIFRSERTARTKTQDGQIIPLKDYHTQNPLDDGQVVDSGGEVLLKIVPVKASQDGNQSRFEGRARKLLAQVKADPEFEAKRIWIDSPIFPRKDLWERLKESRSVRETNRVAEEIAKWMRRHRFHSRWQRGLRQHASELFKAKESLWTYPRSNRPSSDDKRIEFYGKAIAGLMLGIAPATAMRQLLGWSRLKSQPPPPPILAQGPNCPHCGMEEVKGFPAGTVVRCPKCDARYYIASK